MGDEKSENDDDLGVTVVKETSHGGGLGGGGFPQPGGGIGQPDPDASLGSGGAVGGGGGGVPTGVVVDGSTGEVTGTVTIDPNTGTGESSDVDTTTVEEHSHPAPVRGGGSPSDPTSGTTTPPADDSDATPNITPKIDPAIFKFHNVPGSDQESNCVPIMFGFLQHGVPASVPISVPTRFRAPKKLSNGTVMSNRDAADEAATSVVEAALPIQEKVNLGLILPQEAPRLFRNELSDVLTRRGKGFRAAVCFPPGGP